jgi:hypothetical protein
MEITLQFAFRILQFAIDSPQHCKLQSRNCKVQIGSLVHQTAALRTKSHPITKMAASTSAWLSQGPISESVRR